MDNPKGIGSLHRHAIEESFNFVRSKTNFRPTIALILGSGLGDFAETLRQHCVINSLDIPHYPRSTVQGHAGKLVFGHVVQNATPTKPLLVFKGRVHLYESGNIDSVVFPVVLAHKLGARVLIVTNAAGGINPKFRPGDLMLIRDTMSLAFLSPPSRGKTSQQKFTRIDSDVSLRSFTSNDGYFDPKLQLLVRSAARHVPISLKEGTYCWLRGPTYETAAEIRMLEILGADAVGMSTVPEIVVARQLGMKVAAISLISNLATGISPQRLSHQEVTKTANRVRQSFTSLMQEILHRL